jgi:3-oxoacyl-[acyl-carrier protein] reductase
MGNRVALVTGGGRNIGRAICLELARRGHDVVVGVGQGLEAGSVVAGEIAVLGQRSYAAPIDIADPKQVTEMVDEARKRLGPVTILVNNAAIRPTSSFVDLTDEEWHRVIGVNLHGPYYLCKATVPAMIEAGVGSIINVSGTVVYTGGNRSHPVAASKAALQGLTRSLAVELGPFGIRVNTDLLSSIDTVRNLPSASRPPSMDEIPLRRKGTVEDGARVCAFLVSDDSAYITGQAVHVNGGRLLALLPP